MIEPTIHRMICSCGYLYNRRCSENMVAPRSDHWLIVNMFQGDRAVYQWKVSQSFGDVCHFSQDQCCRIRTSYRRIVICVMTYSNPEKRLSSYIYIYTNKTGYSNFIVSPKKDYRTSLSDHYWNGLDLAIRQSVDLDLSLGLPWPWKPRHNPALFYYEAPKR